MKPRLPRFRRPHIYLLALLLLAVANGVIAQVLYENPSGESIANALFLLPSAVSLYLWCKADARWRNVAVPSGASVLVPMVALIGVPYYFFRTYTFARALLHTAFAVTFAIALSSAIWVGKTIVYHVQTR